MEYDHEDLSGQAIFEDLKDSEVALQESFEAMIRSIDSYTALNSLLVDNEKYTTESFESRALPVLTAITAGTDVDLSSIDLSMESVKGMVSSAIDSIILAIKTFFRNLITFLSNLDIASAWLLRKTSLLERTAFATRGKRPTSSTLEMGRMYRYLRVGRIFADDAMRIEHELIRLSSTIKLVSKEYTDSILEAANKLPSQAKDLNGTALEQALVHLVQSIPFDNLASKFNMSPTPKERFHRDGVQSTEPLIGGHSVFYLKSNLGEKGTRGFRFHGFIYQNSTPEVFQIESTRVFKTLGVADVISLPKHLKEILTTISKNANADRRGKIDRARATLESFLKQSSSNSTLTQADVDNLRRTTSALTYWLNSVTGPMYSNSMSVCRAVLTYCNMSLNLYK